MNQLKPNIADFLGSPVSDTSLADLMESFHTLEQKKAKGLAHQLPYHQWPRVFDTAEKQAIIAHVETYLHRATSSVTSMVLCLAVLMRLRHTIHELHQTCAHRLEGADPTTLSTGLLFEACNILHSLRSWDTLAVLATRGLKRFSSYCRTAAIFSDWIVLARYRNLVPHFSTNTLTQTLIDQFAEEVEGFAAHIGRENKNAFLHRGIIANLRQDLEGAIDLMLQAQKAEGCVLKLFQRLENFIPPSDLNTAEHPAYKQLEAKCTFHLPHQATGKTTLLISSDKVYFDKYAEKLFESFGYWNKGAILHIHCVDFTPEPSLLEKYQQQYDIKINHTQDDQSLIKQGSAQFKGYCAGARYIFLPSYLKIYGKIVISDIDGLIMGNIDSIWGEAQGAIIISTKILDEKWHSARLLWEVIAAGSLGITHSDENLNFAAMISHYLCDQIAFCQQNNLMYFYTDQIGILLAFLRCKDTCRFETRHKSYYRQGSGWAFGEGEGKAQVQQKASYH